MKTCSTPGCLAAEYCKGLCKPCYQHQWYKANAERERARRNEYYRNNTQAVLAANKANRKLHAERERARARRRKGMTDPPGAAVSGQCPICPFVGPLVCDHDHSTGKVRGFICGNCNLAAGMLKDSSSAARNLAQYLESHGRD